MVDYPIRLELHHLVGGSILVLLGLWGLYHLLPATYRQELFQLGFLLLTVGLSLVVTLDYLVGSMSTKAMTRLLPTFLFTASYGISSFDETAGSVLSGRVRIGVGLGVTLVATALFVFHWRRYGLEGVPARED